jgi:glycerol-3-phosphate acyltransferase PlsY
MTAQLGLFALFSYLLGAVPFGLLIGFSRGIDIRKVGSGNIGATNVMRSVGKPWGIATFIADAIKGFVPAFLFPRWVQADPGLAGVIFGFAAILGHNFPIYLKFKGGKGVATSAGAVLGIAPLAVLIGLVTWAAFFFSTRYVSLASIVTAIVIPAVSWVLYRGGGILLPSALTVLGLLIVIRHRSNIQRLLNGTENRFTRKRESAEHAE